MKSMDDSDLMVEIRPSRPMNVLVSGKITVSTPRGTLPPRHWTRRRRLYTPAPPPRHAAAATAPAAAATASTSHADENAAATTARSRLRYIDPPPPPWASPRTSSPPLHAISAAADATPDDALGTVLISPKASRSLASITFLCRIFLSKFR
jgi:hypothetical protein